VRKLLAGGQEENGVGKKEVHLVLGRAQANASGLLAPFQTLAAKAV